jgi:hypothetical protein
MHFPTQNSYAHGWIPYLAVGVLFAKLEVSMVADCSFSACGDQLVLPVNQVDRTPCFASCSNNILSCERNFWGFSFNGRQLAAERRDGHHEDGFQ